MSKSPRKQRERAQAPSAQYVTMHPGPTVEALGKTWRFGFNTNNAKGRLEELIRARVVRDALKLRGEVGGAEGEILWKDARDSLAAGHYDTFGEGWFVVLKSGVGSTLFTLSLLQKHHPDATERDASALLANEREQVEAALAVVAPDFFSAVARQMATERGMPPEKANQLAAAILAAISAPAIGTDSNGSTRSSSESRSAPAEPKSES